MLQSTEFFADKVRYTRFKMFTIVSTTDKEKSDEDIDFLRVELWGWVMYIFSNPWGWVSKLLRRKAGVGHVFLSNPGPFSNPPAHPLPLLLFDTP